MSARRNDPAQTRPGIYMTVTTWDRVRAAAWDRGVTPSRLVELFVLEGLDRLIPLEELRLTRPPSKEPNAI